MLDNKIKTAVEPLVAECVPGLYTGEAEEYCTFNCTEIPSAFGDNRPHAVRYLVQLHWFLPLKRRPYPKKKALRRALMAVRGFAAPTITDATDGDGQHYVYELEAVHGDV